MPKTKISEYSATANSNTDVASINIDEGCAPSGINNAIRAVMGHLKDFQQGTYGDPFNGPVNGTLGATTASTVAATTLTTSSTVTHNGGTANGVAYLNGSKVLTTGSALVFDGTNLGLGVTPPTSTDAGNITIKGGSTLNFSTASGNMAANATFNSGWKYIATAAAVKYTQSGAEHQWFNAASGTAGNAISFTQAMTLDASGNLGVGVTAPQNKLQVVTTTRPQFSVSYNGTTGLYLEDATNSAWKSWKLSTSFGAGSDLSFVQSTNTSGTPTWAATAAMTLDSSGNLLVGTTSVNSVGVISVDFLGQTKQGITLDDTWASTGGVYVLFRNSAGDTAGRIDHNGTTTVAYTTSSDYRLKENIAPMTGALVKVLQLNPVTYKWKSDGTDGQGFIAHELQAIVPDAVVGAKDAMNEDGSINPQGIDTSFLVATLTAAIQELNAKFEEYKAAHP